MCKSRAEGGQRCFSHARKTLDSALAERERIRPQLTLAALGNLDAVAPHTVHAIEARILRAQLDIASTPQGRAELQAQADKAAQDQNLDEERQLRSIIERGDLLRERNAALGNLNRNDQWRKQSPARGRPTLTADQTRHYLAQSLTPDQAAAACRDLTETLATLQRSAKHRRRRTPNGTDTITTLLNPQESLAEDARRAHQWAAFDTAHQRWATIRETATTDTSVWVEFIDTTRADRDSPNSNVAFLDDYRRDSNFVLRICAEIVYHHTAKSPRDRSR